MKGLKFLVIPVLASLLLPLGNVHAALDLGDTVDSVVQEVESVLGESDLTIDTTYDYDYEWDYGDYEYDYEDLSEEDLATALTAIAGVGILTGGAILLVILVILVLFIPFYIYGGITLMKIGKKLGYENCWFAWVPVLNVIMLYQLGGISPWFVLVNFAPLLLSIFAIPIMLINFPLSAFYNLFRTLFNIATVIATTVLGTIAFVNISEKRGMDKFLGLLNLIPLGNLVLLGILAWGKGKDEA